jgi:dienelactone hydrolase
MKTRRRQFLTIAGSAGIGAWIGLPSPTAKAMNDWINNDGMQAEEELTLIGPYGQWARSLTAGKIPSLSFRNKATNDVESWRSLARKQVLNRLAMPALTGTLRPTIIKEYDYDGLQIQELTWQLPYGRATQGIALKPQNVTGQLPGILALHDHGGNKFYGAQKIVRTSDHQHPMLVEHQKTYYEGFAWANEIAKRGYVVLVPDAFPFASRRVMISDVPVRHRQNLKDPDATKPSMEEIESYNRWAGDHEHIMAKSLFSAGTTWPGVWLAEDMKALDILCNREDVDKNRVGCCGLSGGGMRSDFLAGLDDRIRCAVPVGFMTTWNDFALYTSFTHTWMIYVPLLPNELDFPEILGLRAPLPSLVLNNSEDQLFTLSEMKRADEILKEVYAKANAVDKYKASFYPGPHKFDAKMQKEAFEWFDRWLKN